MFCEKCGGKISPTDDFCHNCGARAEDSKKSNYKHSGRQKPRKDYSNLLYAVLGIVPMSSWLGLNDFYAGYYKLAFAKLITSGISIIYFLSSPDIVINEHQFILVLLGAVLVLGFIEAALAFSTVVISIPNNVYWSNRLDMLLDIKGVQEAIYRETGFEVKLKFSDGKRP